jgi:hypothetical protein
MYKNYGISRVGNYASLRGIKVSKVDQSGIDTETSFINPVIVNVRGKIGDEIYVDSINQIEYYDVYADSFIVYLENVDERANCLKIDIICGGFNTTKYTSQGDVLNFEILKTFDISYNFPLDSDINISVRAVNSEINMESEPAECVVRFQRVVEAPVIDTVYRDEGSSYTPIPSLPGGRYVVDPIFSHSIELEKGEEVFYLVGCVLSSDCCEKSGFDGRGINSQVIEFSYNDGNNVVTFGLRYDFENNESVGEVIIPKNFLGIKSYPLISSEIFNSFTVRNKYGTASSDLQIITNNISLPLNTDISIRMYICKDDGREIRSNYSNAVIISFGNGYISAPNFERMVKYENDIFSDILPMPFQFGEDDVVDVWYLDASSRRYYGIFDLGEEIEPSDIIPVLFAIINSNYYYCPLTMTLNQDGKMMLNLSYGYLLDKTWYDSINQVVSSDTVINYGYADRKMYVRMYSASAEKYSKASNFKRVIYRSSGIVPPQT